MYLAHIGYILDHNRVTGHQIRPGNLKIDGRLFLGFVFGVEDPSSGCSITRPQTLLLLGDSVFQEIKPAVSPNNR
jgi:hypothetical protein